MHALIRPATHGDMGSLNAIYNHYITTSAITFDVEPWTQEQRAAWLDQRIGSGERVLAAELDGRAIGFGWTGPFRPKAAYRTTAELSVYLHADACGRGVGSALLEALLAELRQMDRHVALGGLTIPNPASRAMLVRHGFTSVGVLREVGFKLGRFWDVEWLERRV